LIQSTATSEPSTVKMAGSSVVQKWYDSHWKADMFRIWLVMRVVEKSL